MSVFQCKDHGVSGVVMLCPHIYREYLEKSRISSYNEVFEIIDEDFEDMHIICDRCMEKYGLSNNKPLENMPEEYLKENKSICKSCFDEWKE